MGNTLARHDRSTKPEVYDGNENNCLNAYSGGLDIDNHRCVYDKDNKKCSNSSITCNCVCM